MSRLHVFIDGTWLYNQCNRGACLANATAMPDRSFPFSFSRLGTALLGHVAGRDPACTELGDCFIATSIFSLPGDFHTWPQHYPDISEEQVERTTRNIAAREAFFRGAIDAGFKEDAIFRPPIRDYIMRRLAQRRYQEKQVDTSVVALLVRSAIMNPDDYHCVLTGDSDILPAIRVAYPEYTRNVFVCSTHPDELQAAHRQTSFSLFDFNFGIPPFFLQDNAHVLMEGNHVHRCGQCGRAFATLSPLPRLARPYCVNCRPRT